MRVDLFKPPDFTKSQLNINSLNVIIHKHLQYASSGKASIYHILKSLKKPEKVLIPVYICDSVLVPLKKLKIEPIFYDIDKDDLNGSIESIEYLAKKFSVKNLMVASLYGNPANLTEIEKLCKEKGIKLIDDAAQSYGAILEDRFVGTFGNAGFFSFSPGKATAGHMGSFFWTEDQYLFKKTKHCIAHYITWLDFYYNRYKCYSQNILFYKDLMKILKLISLKYSDLYNDQICEFEKPILGGILALVESRMRDFRLKFIKSFTEEFSNNSQFRIVSSIRGISNNHKIVLQVENAQYANKIISYCINKRLTITNGYHLLSKNRYEVPAALAIENRILELPVEDDERRMEYMFNTFREALNTY
jgi:dTDP-4-amino-4,6-dideoxygalactose transaminase